MIWLDCMDKRLKNQEGNTDEKKFMSLMIKVKLEKYSIWYTD